MKLIQLFTFILLSTFSYAQKQNLYESIEYKRAYENGTRQRNGLPGKSYWENRSEYEINANFDPITRLIDGQLKVTYFNESPDSLNIIVFKLMQNLYRKGANRQIAIDAQNVHEGIEISNISINGIVIPDSIIDKSSTVMTVRTPTFIKQNDSSTIMLDFKTPISKSPGLRSGTIDKSSFFMAYWFPQIAVYDDIFGWDRDEYVGVPETYNDFSNYEVSLTLPSEYNVWATGEHVNEEEIFSSEILNRIQQSKKSTKSIKIIDEKDFRKPDGNKNIWKFRADNVPDFAWGTSDHYIWEGMSAQNPAPNNLCWVQTAYAKGDPNFDWVLEVAKNCIEVFSKKFPGVPYPYFKHISFSGTQGGGMEFPMLANNFAVADSTSTIVVTAHELAHNYYPFMMGINERKYGWWDETMTTLMEDYLSKSVYPKHKMFGFFNRKVSFPYIAPRHTIMPLMTETSSMMKVQPTIVNFYVKGPAMIDMLVNLIGSDKFFAYNKEFMKIWVGKHPTPYDLFFFYQFKRRKKSELVLGCLLFLTGIS